MGHNHSHHIPHPTEPNEARHHQRILTIALCLTLTFMVVELIAGHLTGSLALIADAAHMGTDSIGLLLALLAVTAIQRTPSTRRTYGSHRLEVLTALAHAALLTGVAGYVLYEAFSRIGAQHTLATTPLLITASAGLAVNIIVWRLLASGSKTNLNLTGARLEVLADLIGSLAVIVGAMLVATTGWVWIDTAVALGIAVFIIPRTWALARTALRILLESAPPETNLTQLRRDLLTIPGVIDVHDLHVWSITTDTHAASAHLIIDDPTNHQRILTAALRLFASDHNIPHATIQCEPRSQVCTTGTTAHP
ncbi:cation diffusion facilitator family transporter [Jonesia quinghaiensis]|uniref:cation diffusion facilitator family transporter n=1 Tax=Jonesia quinghaiensis TaxID=262806 RepID=UPI0004122833|nr:cation diffusion facilitator family transporter [Jonesia quinghaiensis]